MPSTPASSTPPWRQTTTRYATSGAAASTGTDVIGLAPQKRQPWEKRSSERLWKGSSGSAGHRKDDATERQLPRKRESAKKDDTLLRPKGSMTQERMTPEPAWKMLQTESAKLQSQKAAQTPKPALAQEPLPAGFVSAWNTGLPEPKATTAFTGEFNKQFPAVYVQGDMENFASFHFDSARDIYMSYSSPECEKFPPLDDGSRPPKRKDFILTSFASEFRIFQGEIDWSPSSWMGHARWHFRMQFSKDFDSIIGGERRGFGPVKKEGDIRPLLGTKKFGSDLIYSRKQVSRPGKCYVQNNTIGLASIHFDPQALLKVHLAYDHPECSKFPPLDDGSRPPAKKPFTEVKYDPVERNFSGIIDWSPTTWMGAAYWEFTFQFSPDFGEISTGTRKAFKKPESPWKPPILVNTRGFFNDLVYTRATDDNITRSRVELQKATWQAGAVGSTPPIDARTKTIAFTIEGSKFIAEIIADRAAVGKIKTNTHIRYTSGHDGREWIFIDPDKLILNDEWGHNNVPFKYVPDGSGTKRPLSTELVSTKRAR